MFSLVHQLHPILLPYVSNNIEITIRIPFLYRRIWNKEFRKIEISVPLVSVLVKDRNRKSKQQSPSKIVSKIRVKGSRPVGILKSLAIEQKFTPPATMAIDSRDHHQYHPSKIFYLPWSTRTYELLVTTEISPSASPFSLGNPLRLPNYIPTSHTHSIHDYARDRRESNDDTIPIGSKQRSITGPQYDRALSRELGLEASLNYAAVASNVLSPLSLSLQVFSFLGLSPLSRQEYPGDTTVASAIVGSLSRPVTSRNGNRGQVYFSPCLITGGNSGGGSWCTRPGLSLPLLESLDLTQDGWD